MPSLNMATSFPTEDKNYAETSCVVHSRFSIKDMMFVEKFGTKN